MISHPFIYESLVADRHVQHLELHEPRAGAPTIDQGDDRGP
jgi:hypothetical protein